ncbi:apolipoprotein N-acyltransferase [Corynebacterium marinum]|uniref:Apolipoprotein N-acyltransferase n=1 Tax=Corynebacterium marinum DSM 44953 TaxID=1224162 RepID=A0A0B6TFW5_9CORY|nr:apolipoprotein N-acyltransferase [Corynebacterium marinum]AJK68847.1 apolipoprotein N-acyltransferase [Corynebacterium marinum DSM 44953]GGO21133.1 apolipoprotein N-acyltransferase [Corynebacterium marinum]
MILLLRLLLAAASGFLAFTSNEPLGWWIAGVLGMAGLYVSVMPWKGRPGPSLRAGALIGFVHALVVYLFMLPWIGEFVGNLPYVALSVFCALYALAAGLGGVAVARWRYGFLAFPFVYVLVEWARSSFPFGGFAWVRLTWGQVNGPLADLAVWGGPALVTLAAVVVGAGLAGLLTRDRRVRVTAVAAVILPSAAGLLTGLTVVDREEATVGQVTVAAVQGNVPRMGLDFNAQRRAVLTNHVNVTEQLAAQVGESGEELDLVIWPENSSDVNPFADERAGQLVAQAVAAVDTPVLVGTITRDEVGDRNTMVVMDPETGRGDHHHKHFLQPFGEYMPMRDFFRMFSPYVDQAGDFKPGPPEFTVRMDDIVLGVATCYEVAFDPAYRQAVLDGAQLLSTPTNNATFGFTDMTYQQLAMSRMRAIEVDRALVVAATSGVSAIVHPDGSVSQETGIFEPGTLVETLPLRDSLTFAARYGHIVQLGLIILGGMLLAAALVTARRKPLRATGKPRPSTPHRRPS